jgi:hypothetical protein
MGVQPTPATRGDDNGAACPFHDAAFFLGVGGAAMMEVEQSASPPPMSSCGRYILHRVCRFDTLAGVAIKYGVEVCNHQTTQPPPSPSFFDPPHRFSWFLIGWMHSSVG